MTIELYEKIETLAKELEDDTVLQFLAKKLEEEAWERLSPADKDLLTEEDMIGY